MLKVRIVLADGVSRRFSSSFFLFSPISQCDRVIRDSMNEQLPVYGLRTWEHSKRITVPSGTFIIDCKGYILSNRAVMFVDCAQRSQVDVRQPTPVKTEDYVWDDADLFSDLKWGDDFVLDDGIDLFQDAAPTNFFE